MIKIKNIRNAGSLFHYAHFICDCLFPEIINDIYKYDTVVREKNIHQTIGNFNKLYENVMMNKNVELDTIDFDNLKTKIIIYNKNNYIDNIYFNKFRNFIFTRYSINSLIYNKNYPEIILIKRGGRINLIDDIELKNINKNITTGYERREINKIECVDEYLKKKYSNRFKSIFLEEITFYEQVKYFNNSKLIICAHGAAMSNMFFCKIGTTIIEITCDTYYPFFDIISKNLQLNHIKCNENNFDIIINIIKINEI